MTPGSPFPADTQLHHMLIILSSIVAMHLTSLLALIPAVAASCFHNTPLARRVSVPSYGYTATQGPLNWYGLDPSTNVACATGTHQSPIVIGSSEISKVNNSTVTLYIPTVSDLEFENLGTTIEVPLTNGTLVVGNNTYTLAQFHFHTPSEHRIDEEHFPMEAHFVFSDEGTRMNPSCAYFPSC